MKDISSILVPIVCFGCNAHLLGGERVICTSCRNNLPTTDFTFDEENSVDRIFYGRVNIKKANSFLFFTENGIVQKILHHLKYKNQEIVGDFIGEWFGSTIKNNGFIDKIDYVIPVPLHAKKLRQRGYNQVTRFGLCLAKHIEAEFREDILMKTSNSKSQTKKGRLGRWFENKALYTLSNSEAIRGKNVLLIDDIITTGATIEMCTTTLQQAKNVNVYVASMAVVPFLYK